MKLSACFKDKLKNEAAFILIEIIIVIAISSLLAVIFMDLIYGLYQKNSYFNLENDWQLDAYLAVDFIADQIKNSTKVELINEAEIDIYSYYHGSYQWLKFCSYKSKNIKNLSRKIGSQNLDFKDFGRNLSMLDNIKNIKFKKENDNLLKITLAVQHKKESLIVSRLINL